nr:MAG TPA: hypothetical protein [Caudoviricetes sp.]
MYINILHSYTTLYNYIRIATFLFHFLLLIIVDKFHIFIYNI